MKKPPKVGEGTTFLPATRKMTVVAQDPSVKRADGTILMSRIDVPGDDLIPGPIGYRVQIVDYDASAGTFHGAHVLPTSLTTEPPKWIEGDPTIVDDPTFRAQNTYALVMKTLARFEFALGRRIGWSFKVHQLKVAPTGVREPNAFYSRDVEGLVFGYFDGSGKEKETIYTCLSHDIVVHETTHALLDALRKRYMDPSGPDQSAFHEGFSDVVALLSVYSQRELVEELLRGSSPRKMELTDEEVSPARLRKTALFGLAEQMGAEMEAVRGDALRRSAEMEPSRAWMQDPEFDEPHRRGEILVAAVMNGFLEAWTTRLQSTKVTGQETHHLRRVAEEGSDIAAALATMWIRALDYMPPVHLTFADALSAAITADSEARPDDSRYRLRACMLASFEKYGIKPASTRPDQTGAWRYENSKLHYERVRFESMRTDHDEVFRFLWDNRAALKLRIGAYAEVLSVRPCTRVGTDGFTLRETVAEYYQVARLTEAELEEKKIRLPAEYVEELAKRRAERDARREKSLGDSEAADATAADASDTGDTGDAPEEAASDSVTPVYGGGVLIFDEYGKVKYHIHNDVFGSRQTARLLHLWETGNLRAEADGARLSPERLSDMHRRRATSARRFPAEGW